ncbi:MAG: ATP synthase F0 subunit C [Candidatus Peribacteria bacterium]|nr:MAG: ATP synthase F0 subunit C [Candidatus Peribacteria bacterium]
MTTFGIFGAALAIGMPAIGVAFGEGIAARKSLDTISKNPDIKGFVTTITILGMALVESIAIYGLLIANSII